MLKKTYRFNKSEILFFSAWILFLLSLLIGATTLQGIKYLVVLAKGLRYLAYLICCAEICRTKIKKNKTFILIFIFLIFIISCISSTNKTLLLYLLVLFASINIDKRKIMRLTTRIQGFFLAIVVLLSRIGIMEDHLFGRNSDRIRHGLGFSWTTTGPILYFYFMLGYIYLRKEKFGVGEAILLEIINILFYQLTDTRMAFMLSTLFLIFFSVQNLNRRRWRKLSKLKGFYLLIPTALCILAFVSAIYFNQNQHTFAAVNKLLSNRLMLGHQAIKQYGFTLFGQPIKWMGYSIKHPMLADSQYNYVDSSYLQLALNYGMLLIAVVVAMYTYGIYKAIRQQDYYLVFIYLFVLVFALTEPRLMNFAFNPFPLMIFSGKPIKKWKRVPNFRQEESGQQGNQPLLDGEMNA